MTFTFSLLVRMKLATLKRFKVNGHDYEISLSGPKQERPVLQEKDEKCRYLVGSCGSVKIHTPFDKTGDANKEHWFRRDQGK